MAVVYKFAEVAPVTDEELERTVNRVSSEGWHLDAIHFAMREGSHRPAMAFVAFIRQDDAATPKDQEK